MASLQQQTCCGCFTPRSFVFFSWGLNTVMRFAAIADRVRAARNRHATLAAGRFSRVFSPGYYQLAPLISQHGKLILLPASIAMCLSGTPDPAQ